MASRRNDGMAMTTRISTGTIVQATSSQRVVGGPRGRRIGLLVELPDHIDQQAQHEKADAGDDRQQDVVVEEMDFFGDRGHRLLNADLTGLRQCQRRSPGRANGRATPASATPSAAIQQLVARRPNVADPAIFMNPLAPDCVAAPTCPVGRLHGKATRRSLWPRSRSSASDRSRNHKAARDAMPRR